MAGEAEQQLRAYVEYLRDMGIHDFYRQGEPVYAEPVRAAAAPASRPSAPAVPSPTPPSPRVPSPPIAAAQNPARAIPPVEERRPIPEPPPARPAFLEPPIAKLISFDNLAPLPESRVAPAHKPEALASIKDEIGDCTRCPLSYAA